VAAAASLWALERRKSPRGLRPSLAEALLAAYVCAAAVSYLASEPAAGSSAGDVAAVLGLALLAALTADFASDAESFRWIAKVVCATSIATAAAAAAGLALFYLGYDTSLVGAYGALAPSDEYARTQAGFSHPALLGSYCIFASAVVAQGRDVLSPRLRRGTQIALGLTVLSTFSRAIIGFGVAVALRNARSARSRTIAVSAAMAGLALMALLTFTRISLDPAQPLDVQISTRSDSVREQELGAAIDTLGDHPLFGWGPGTLPGYAPGYGPRQAHNTPVGVAATMGIPAVLVLAALLIVLWRRRGPGQSAIWAGLAGLGIDGLGQDVERFRHVWVMIGLAGAESRQVGGSRSTTSRRDT
jgi:O-antigen ligase